MKPRALFVGRTRYRLPLADWLERKWTAIGQELDFHVLASADPANTGSDPRFELAPALAMLDGAAFYLRLPFRVHKAVRALRPQAIVAEDPRTAALVMLARSIAGKPHPRVICEVHGDWRHSTRLYGSEGRRLVSPFVDAIDRYGVRRADAVRALSAYTAGLVEDLRGREPDAVFPTFTDLSVFTAPLQPLPERPTALFVGVLERYKNVDGLAMAWRIVAGRVPGPRLVLVGKGPMRDEIERLAADLPGRVEHVAELPPEGVARALDEATLLVLPSRHEGLGRVVIEAFARGRGVVASRAGGILDLVDDGIEGLLVEPEDTAGLADALGRVLSDRALAESLGAAASARFGAWNQSADEFARRMKALVDSTLL